MVNEPTKLGRIVQAKAAAAPKPEADPSKLAEWSKLGKRGDYADIQGIGRVWIQLSPHSDTNAVESETWAEMRALDLPPISVNAITFDTEKAVRTLARCVREPEEDRHQIPFGTVEDWHALDDDMISIAFQSYNDVRARLHPSVFELTEVEIREISEAISKKNEAFLRTFGVAKLSRYMLTTAERPSGSQIGKSSSGELASESSITKSSSE